MRQFECGTVVPGCDGVVSGDTDDLFALQDELTQRVVNEIAGSYGALTRAKLSEARRKPPASLDSYDCVLRAYEYLHVHVAEKHLAARDCMERVVEADPDYADGHAWLGYLYADQFHHRWNDRPEEYVALRDATDPSDPDRNDKIAALKQLQYKADWFQSTLTPDLISPIKKLRSWAFVLCFLGIGLSTRFAELATFGLRPFWAFTIGALVTAPLGHGPATIAPTSRQARI